LEINRVVDITSKDISIYRVLDVSTGSGVFAEAFTNRGFETVGLDANPEFLSI